MLANLQELGIYLDSNTTEPLGLKNLIEEQFVDCHIPTTLRLKITVAPNTHISLADDIIEFSDLEKTSLIKHTIDLVIHENSNVHYAMKVAPITLDKPTELSENKHHAVVSKEINVKLVGKHAQAHVICACYGNKNTVYTFKTLQEHIVEDTASTLVIKSVLDDSAKIISNNMIQIKKAAQRTNAEQSNKNIILGSGARAIANPQLEIEANNVKCKHGAAMSKLNSEQFFYLQSRGLDAIQTKNMLVDAFLS